MAAICNYAFVDGTCHEYGTVNGRHNMPLSQIADGDFVTAVYRECGFNCQRFYKMDELSKACFIAAELTIRSSRVEIDGNDAGVVFFNRDSSIVTDRNFEKTISGEGNFFPSPSLFVYTLPNILTGEICIHNGFKGESAFYVLDAPDAKYIADIVGDMLAYNGVVVCGWSDMVDGKIRAAAFVAARGSRPEGSVALDEDGVRSVLRAAFKN